MFVKFIFVMFRVISFIVNEFIEPELLIDVEVILFVCKLPLDMILPDIVWFPEIVKLLQELIFVNILIIQ